MQVELSVVLMMWGEMQTHWKPVTREINLRTQSWTATDQQKLSVLSVTEGNAALSMEVKPKETWSVTKTKRNRVKKLTLILLVNAV